MKKKIIFLIIICGSFVIKSYSQNWIWSKQFGGTGSDKSQSLVVDNLGNCYISGYFTGTTNFSDTTLTSIGNSDIFLAKFNNNGELLWISQAGGTNSELSMGIALDSQKNIFITGSFSGSCSFGTNILSSVGSQDIFLAKCDSMGNFLWARQAGGSSDDLSNAIEIDSYNNPTITGYFDHIATFDTIILNGLGGYRDVFIARYDNNGNILWAKQASSKRYDVANSISIDGVGNSYITGSFRDTIHFETSILISAGHDDIFIAKYDNFGNIVWVKQAGGSTTYGGDQGFDIVVDSLGNSYITGGFSISATFDTITINSISFSDIFIAKYDVNGTLLWVRHAGGHSEDWGSSIVVDDLGNCFVTGCYQSSGVTFGTTTLPVYGSTDVFVAKYNSYGEFIWVNSGGSSWVDWPFAISINNSGDIFVSGTIEKSAIFGTDTLPYNGSSDIFLAKLDNLVGITDIPYQAKLVNIFPNPFCLETTIKINQNINNAIMYVYNNLGQEVRLLRHISNQEFKFYREDLPSGLYFFKIIQSYNQTIATGKMIIE